MALTVVANGVLTNPDFHDGYLTGISVGDDKTLILCCKTVKDDFYEVVIPSLIRLRADNFSEGNIIFEVNIHEGSSCLEKLVKKLYGYDAVQAAIYLPRHMHEIREKNWTIIELTSSYGCELLALSASSVSEVLVRVRSLACQE